MAQFGMHEAKTTLSKLVERATAGEEIVIARNGTPVAKLVPIERKRSRRDVIGVWEGKVWMADDFDELPDGFAEAFGIE